MADVLGEIIATSNDVQAAVDQIAQAYSSGASPDQTTSDSNSPGQGLFESIGNMFTNTVQALQGVQQSNVVGQIQALLNPVSVPKATAAKPSAAAAVKSAFSSPIIWMALAGVGILLLVVKR